MENDLIERQAAIDEIDEWIKAFLEQGYRESAADACLIQDGIIQLPSAQPEQPKRGTWIKHEDRAGWCCSECAIDDYYAYFLNSDTGVYELQDKFCYNCGADMRGEQDE